MCALVAKRTGAGNVKLVGLDRDADRLKMAEKFGVQTVNCQSDNGWRAEVEGADLVIDASGSAQAIRECFDVVSRAGRLVPIGIACSKMEIPWNIALNKETTVSFSYSSKAANWDMALSILANLEFPADKLVSHTLSLDDWQEGFRITWAGEG